VYCRLKTVFLFENPSSPRTCLINSSLIAINKQSYDQSHFGLT